MMFGMGSGEIILLLERYVGIPFVGWLIDNHIIVSGDKDVWVQIVSHVLSILVMIVMLIISKERKQPVVSATGEITVTQNKFFLQPLADFLKAKFTTQDKPKEAFVSTGETTIQ